MAGSRRWAIILACALTPMLCPQAKELKVGVLTSWKGGVWDASRALLGIMPAMFKINNDTALLPGYNLSFVWADTHCRTPDASAAALRAMSSGVNALFGSPCSGDCLDIGPM